MHLIWRLFIIFKFFCLCLCHEAVSPKVAIIGGGIGGASASHFLTELFNNNVDIDLFEYKKIGGRLATVEIGNQKFEAGGSIIHPRNKYMKDFISLIGLEKKPDSSNGLAGIWNGDKFVFKESEYSLMTYLSIFYRYGIEPYQLYRYINSILSDFENIYTLHDKGLAFENVNKLLTAMNAEFPQMLQMSIKDHLRNLGYRDKLIDELVMSTLVVNYGQDVDVHSFVGAVSLAGATGGLWSVKGGNYEVPQHLIRRNPKVTVIPSQVEKIRYLGKNDSSLYEVFYYPSTKSNVNILSSKYDIVILATLMPCNEDQIIFENFPPNIDLSFPGECQTTVATFLQGTLNHLHFGLKEPLGAILSCNPNKTIISSIGKLSSVFGETVAKPVWKVFTRKSLNPKYLAKIIKNINNREKIVWKAYPKYSTNFRKDTFILHEFLYYVNAIEWAASAMEMSAIGGRNVAILAHKHYTNKKFPQKVTTPHEKNKSEL